MSWVHGLAVAVDARELFVADPNNKSLAVLDADTGRLLRVLHGDPKKRLTEKKAAAVRGSGDVAATAPPPDDDGFDAGSAEGEAWSAMVVAVSSDGATACYVGNNNALCSVDPLTGDRRWRYEVAGGCGIVSIASELGVPSLPPASGQPGGHADTDDEGGDTASTAAAAAAAVSALQQRFGSAVFALADCLAHAHDRAWGGDAVECCLPPVSIATAVLVARPLRFYLGCGDGTVWAVDISDEKRLRRGPAAAITAAAGAA